MESETQHSKAFDLVVFGATSFVGKIICQYLVSQYSGPDSLTWAIAGRSRQKLDKLKADLGDGAKDLTTIIADTSNPQSLELMCE